MIEFSMNVFDRILRETSFSMPKDKGQLSQLKKSSGFRIKNDCRILIRTADEAGYGNSKAYHACSVKIYSADKASCELDVPTKYFPDKDKAYNKIQDFKKSDTLGLPTRVREAFVSFIYDNQMAIVAYWYLSGRDLKTKDILDEYFKNQIIKNNYVRNGLSGPKSKEDLENDKNALRNYVWMHPSGSTTELNFGQ